MLAFITAFLSTFRAGSPLVWISATIWLFKPARLGRVQALWVFFVISGIDNIGSPC